MKIDDDDDRLIIIAAFRYALGRCSYMPSVIAEKIESLWPELLPQDRKLIQSEITEAIDRDHAGHECDVAAWERLLELEA